MSWLENWDQHWDGLEISSGPAAEPISTADAKRHLRVDFTEEDDYIDLCVKAARVWFEQQTNTCLITQTVVQYHEDWPCENHIKLRRGPVSGVTSIQWTATDNTTVTTLVAGTDYLVNLKRRPARIVLPYAGEWPSGTLTTVNPIKITYTAGFGAAATSIDADIMGCLRFLLGYFYENREAVVVGVNASILSEMPIGVRDVVRRCKLPYHG